MICAQLSSHADPPTEVPPGQAWTTLLQRELDHLFKVALLLSADGEVAETCLNLAIQSIDCSQPPSAESSRFLKTSVALVSIQRTMSSFFLRNISSALHLIPLDLRPVLRMELTARVCFVTRALLGYPAEWCAEVLGIDKTGIALLFGRAAAQLAATRNLTLSNTFE